MKILVVSTMTVAPWGGSEELWAAMAREALARGHDVTLSVRRWPSVPAPIAALARAGARVRDRHPRRSRFDRMLDRVRSPLRELERRLPDVLCLSQGWAYDFLAVPGLADFCRRTEIPQVIACHAIPEQSFLSDADRAVAAEILARAARVLFVSRATLTSVERQLARRLANAQIVRNPVNLADVTPVAWPAEPPVRFACVGHLDSRKAQDTLFEALAAPAWRGRPWRLSLCGAGPDRAYLQALARHYEINDRVDFAGHVDDVRSIWAAHHALVLASRVEGMPLAVVEAMLCGRPSIVTDVGGHTEWLEDGRTGFVAEAPTARSFGRVLERAWQAREAWPSMGERAHAEAVRRLDPSPGGTLLDVLVDAARGPAGGRR